MVLLPPGGSGGVRDDQRLDAAIQLGREDVVALGDVLEWYAMSDDLAGLEVAVADMFEEARPLLLDRALVRADRESFVHGVAELDGAEHGPVGAHHRNRPA